MSDETKPEAEQIKEQALTEKNCCLIIKAIEKRSTKTRQKKKSEKWKSFLLSMKKHLKFWQRNT